MIDNTLKSIDTIKGQLTGIDTARKFLTLFLYSAYLVYRMIVNNGYLALNIVLLVLTLLYTAYFVYFLSADKKEFTEKRGKTIHNIYRWSKLLFSGIGVGLSVSGFLAVGKELSTVNLIFCILIPIFWVLQLVCELIFDYVNYCFTLLKDGINADVENLKKTYEKPIQTVEGVKTTLEGFQSIKEGFSTIAATLWKKKKKDKKQKAVDNLNEAKGKPTPIPNPSETPQESVTGEISEIH